MGWKDLFKSRAARNKPDPRLRWFGKLPTYPDYYSSPADEDWVVEFNEWVMKGYEHYHGHLASADGAVHSMPICACAIRLPKSGMTVLGSILDYGGDMRGRKFPLCLYVGVPTLRWPGPTSDRAGAATAVLGELLALRHEIARFINSPGPLDAVLGGREISLSRFEEDYSDTSWLAIAKDYAMADWWEGARDLLKIKDLSAWLAKTSSWGDMLAAHKQSGFEPTLRFPLAMRVPFDIQLPGWLMWLEHRMDLQDRALSLVVSGDLDYENGFLAVIARDIVPDDFLLTTAQAAAHPYLDDVASLEWEAAQDDETIDPVPDGDMVPSAAAPVENSLERWLDFVQSPCKSA